MPLITQTATDIVFSNSAGGDTLQKAIDLAQTNGLPLFITPGVYTQASATIMAPVTIYARKDSAILRSSTASAFTLRVGGRGAARLPGVVLRGLNFDGENKPLASGEGGLAQFVNADRMVVEDCFFWRSRSAGMDFYASEGRVFGNRCDNCRIAIRGVNSWGLSIESNYLTNSLDNAIECYHDPWATSQPYFDGASIRGNRIASVLNSSGGEGQYGNAIVCSGLQYLRIADNLVSNANFSAIRVAYCREVAITANQVSGTREVAIFVENPADYAGGWSNVVVSSNTLNDVGGGIVCANNNAGSRRATVVGNAIVNVKTNSFALSTGYTHVTHGVGIWAASDCIVEGNVIESAQAAGIAAIFSGTWNGALPDRNSVAAIIANNIVKNCAVGVGYSDADFRTHCEISGNLLVGCSLNIVEMAPTSLPPPAPAGNLYGPPTPTPGAVEMGSTSNAISTRWSFDRNKVVRLAV